MVRPGIDHYAVAVLGVTQLEATAIHIMLASGTLKILAVYLSPSRPIHYSLAERISVTLTELYRDFPQL
jgi:hypothetical protein